MSWRYFPAGVAGSSQQSGSSAGPLSATSNGNNTASISPSNESKTDCLTTRPSGTMPEHSTGVPGLDAWILSRRGSRASPIPVLASNWERMMNAICGPRQLGLFESADPAPCSSKTFPVLSGRDTSLPFSTTYLKQVTRPFPQFDLQLVTLEPIIRGPGSGLWPTPTVDAANERHKPYAQGGHSLSYAVHMFPTPTDPTKGGGSSRSGNRRNETPSLHGMARKGRWPTPTQRDWRSGKRKDSKPRSKQLPTEVGGMLNPRWEEWLMGFPIGWTSVKPLEMHKFRQWLRQFGGC